MTLQARDSEKCSPNKSLFQTLKDSHCNKDSFVCGIRFYYRTTFWVFCYNTCRYFYKSCHKKASSSYYKNCGAGRDTINHSVQLLLRSHSEKLNPQPPALQPQTYTTELSSSSLTCSSLSFDRHLFPRRYCVREIARFWRTQKLLRILQQFGLSQ